MMRIKRNPESGKLLRFYGSFNEMGYDILLQARNLRVRGEGIIVEILDNYNQYSAYTKFFPDTKVGYAEAKSYFNKLTAYGQKLPVRCLFPETLPEALFG